MTEDRMALIELAEQHADEDLLRELGQFVLQRLMDAEAEALCGAGRHERHPERVEPALEELLRYDGPVQATSRFALEDLEIAGHAVRKGHNVMVVIGAANRDPSRYAQPDRLDVTRDVDDHLGFGHGRHFGLGANLARLEAKHAIRGVIERFPNLKLEIDDPPWRPNPILHGLESLPVRV